MSTATNCRKRHIRRPSFHVMVDGCNGPIRFSDRHLEHADTENWRNVVSMTHDQVGGNSKNRKQQNGPKGYSNAGKHNAKDSLDVIPLFQQLSASDDSPFDTFSIIFDGVSRKGRHSKAPEEESFKRKEWKIDDHITIEITGLYDETDNIIVERVEKWDQQNESKHETGDVETLSRMLEKTSLSLTIEKDKRETEPLDQNGGDKHDGVACTVIVVKRSNMGPGKARTILQPLGLFRAESVSCLFIQGFASAALELHANDTLQKKLNHPRVGQNLIQSRQERVLVFSNDQENSDSQEKPSYPLVVTDDVYLRQRIANHGGFVMTFQQLWILLMEVQATTDKDAKATMKDC
jgi:hypothetical protein